MTPALLRRLQGESIANKELSVLLAREQLVPVVHGTTYEALREISPLLASRNGLNTIENAMADVAAKLAELVALALLPGVNALHAHRYFHLGPWADGLLASLKPFTGQQNIRANIPGDFAQ